jgi:hypothetical protein
MKNVKGRTIIREFEPKSHVQRHRTSATGRGDHDSPRRDSLEPLDELKQRLLREKAAAESDPALFVDLRRAAEEAAALAWATPFPLLVLPELFAEKAAEAGVRSERQRRIRKRSRRLIALAA